MAFATLNGVAVQHARLSLPRVGVWTANIGIEAGLPLGKATLTIGGVSFVGKVRRGGYDEGAPVVQLVGGAGGFGNHIDALGYNDSPLSLPLRDIMRAAGESLSASISSDVLGRQMTFWSTVAGASGQAMAHLMRSQGLAWRVLFNGTVWCGVEGWPASAQAYLPLTESPLQDKVTISSQAPDIAPGQTFQGRKVSYVQHVLEAESFHTTVWFE